MAYQKFAFDFTLIDQIVYKIIHILIPLISIFKLSKTRRFHKINLILTSFLLILKICLLKNTSLCNVHILIRKKNKAKNTINELV